MYSEVLPQSRGLKSVDKKREAVSAPREEKRERPIETPERTPRDLNTPPPAVAPPSQPPVQTPPVEEQPHNTPVNQNLPAPERPTPRPTPDAPGRDVVIHPVEIYVPHVVEKSLSPFEQLFEQGIVYYDSGYYDDALVEFDNAMDIDTTEYQLYYYRGCTLLNLDYYEDAIADLDVYIYFFPKDKDALYNRGLAWFYFDNKEKAYWDFDAASKLGDVRAKSLLRRFY